jgi:hypothetical protein
MTKGNGALLLESVPLLLLLLAPAAVAAAATVAATMLHNHCLWCRHILNSDEFVECSGQHL